MSFCSFVSHQHSQKPAPAICNSSKVMGHLNLIHAIAETFDFGPLVVP
jgi:hypothetical protein